MSEFFSSFLLNFFAELGDKTQITALVLATRYGFLTVSTGIFLAILLLQGLAVIFGGSLSSLFKNKEAISIIAGLIFLAFGIANLSSKDKDEDELDFQKPASHLIFSIFALFFTAELGDKTQIATLAKASTSSSLLQTYLGAVFGLFFSNLIGVAAGNFLKERITLSKTKFISSIVFIMFGVYYLAKPFLN